MFLPLSLTVLLLGDTMSLSFILFHFFHLQGKDVLCLLSHEIKTVSFQNGSLNWRV